MPDLMVPGHQAIPGSLIPPSNVVCLPQSSGPLLPPEEGVYGNRVESYVYFEVKVIFFNTMKFCNQYHMYRLLMDRKHHPVYLF